jgi:hypothetical protein
MSSHHIIREDQEPALLIMNANIVSFEYVQELLEWSPTVMVTETALPEVIGWGIKIDVVIATTKSGPPLRILLQDQLPLKIISCNSEDEILPTALYFLQASKQKSVNIISVERLEIFEPFSTLDLSVSQSDKRWSFIRNGLYEKWLPAGRTIHVHSSDQQSAIKIDHDGVIVLQRENGFWVAEE